MTAAAAAGLDTLAIMNAPEDPKTGESTDSGDDNPDQLPAENAGDHGDETRVDQAAATLAIDNPQGEAPASEAAERVAQAPASAAAAPEPQVIVRKSGGALSALALLLALGACLASGWIWWQSTQPTAETETVDYTALIARQGQQQAAAVADQIDQLRAELQQQLAAQQREVERLRAERGGLDQSLINLEESTRRAASAVERRLGHLETSIAALADARTDNTDELSLAETEYLMRAAAERLQLFNDPAGAQRALLLAARQLETVDDPIYMTVRQTLASHQQALESMQLPDRVALSGQLLALARDSVSWPLDARRSLNATGSNLLTPTEDEQGWWPRMKSVLSSVVVVHREKDTATALLTLEEERLLRENVRLQLQVAQLAAVRAEQALYDSALATVRDWINEYYDGAEPAIAGALAQIDELAAVDLNPQLPDISGALRQLRNLRSSESLADQFEAQQ